MKLTPDQRYLTGRAIGRKPSKPVRRPDELWVGPIPFYPDTPHMAQIRLRYELRLAVARGREGEAAALRTKLEGHELLHGVMPG